MAESLFRVFDEDNSGNLNFFEYLQVHDHGNRDTETETDWQANSVTDLDSNEDKLNWIFMAFDQDGGGFIDVQVMNNLIN